MSKYELESIIADINISASNLRSTTLWQYNSGINDLQNEIIKNLCEIEVEEPMDDDLKAGLIDALMQVQIVVNRFALTISDSKRRNLLLINMEMLKTAVEIAMGDKFSDD